MRSFISIVSIVGVFCMAAVCQASDTIKNATIGAKTGDAAIGYHPTFLGIRFAVEELNAQGGLLEKQIELVELDNQSTSLGSKLAAQRAVEAGVIGVVGPTWSSHALAMAPVLQKAKIPMVAVGATNPQVTLVGDYIFRVCFTDSFQGKVMANFAIKEIHAKNAVVLTKAGDPYSVGLARTFMKRFREQGGKVLWEGQFLKDTMDFSSMIEKTHRLKPDIVFLPVYSKDAGLIMKQSRKFGVTAIFLGGDGWSEQIFEYGGEAVNGSYQCNQWNIESQDEKNLELKKKYKSRYGEGATVVSEIALSSDAMFLLADAVRRAHSFDPTRIRDALATTKKFQGATGNITFDQNGDPIKSAVIVKLQNGAAHYLKTIEP